MKYIYESPDKGKTVYRRPVGSMKRELVSDVEPAITFTEDGIAILEDGDFKKGE
jgi:hypothetical protein